MVYYCLLINILIVHTLTENNSYQSSKLSEMNKARQIICKQSIK